MKKTILYLLLFLCNATVFAEEELNSAANFQGTYFVITPEGQHTTLYIEPYKDIMLNEQRYWQYSGNFEGIKYVKSLLLLRKMGTKYFSYDTKTDTEYLLFDFGLKKGDIYTNSFNGIEYDVTDVRDTLVNDKSLCLIELQSQEGNHDIWMEGVGSIYTGIMQPNEYCKEIYMLTSHRYYTTGYDMDLVFYCFYPNDQYIKTADMSITELEWEGGKIETDEDWEAYQKWLYSPTDLNAEFVGDTLHVWGKLRSSCVLQPYAACVLEDNNAAIFTTYSYAEVDCISNYYIETHIPGFEKGKYSVKLSWDKTIELECLGNIMALPEPVTFTKDQIATIILPTTPDASKGKYYRLDRWEEGKIIFEEELHPQARVPYIIIPNEDFSIDPSTMDLEGLGRDRATIEDVYFFGTYLKYNFYYVDAFVYYLLDTTPDCSDERSLHVVHVGPLRAILSVKYRRCVYWENYWEKPGYVLHDHVTSIDETIDDNKTSNQGVYDLQGRRLSGKPARGIYIEDGKKRVKW